MKQKTDWAFLLCLLAILLAVPVGTALWSHKNTSAYYENRTLAEAPVPTRQSVWDGSFGGEVETWYSDHAPGRTTLLKLDTALQLTLLDRPVVNGIVTQAEVLLPFMTYKEWPPEAYAGPATAIAADFRKLSDHVAANGGAFYYVGFPEQRVYFEDAFPAYLSSHKAEAAVADSLFAQAFADQGVPFLDMRAVFAAQGNPAEYYSTVDHHFNYYGAYAAYRSILDTLREDGIAAAVLTEGDLAFQELPNPYLGSRNRKLYNLWPNEDRAVIATQKTPVAYTRWDEGAPSEKPLFVLPAAPELPTTYNLYMGGDFAETVFETNRPELPNALIFGDSFTNAMETLLYASFNETRILDLRHYTQQSLKDYITEHRPDVVLSIQNDTFYYTRTGNGAVWPEE